jgi:hypothetical protein
LFPFFVLKKSVHPRVARTLAFLFFCLSISFGQATVRRGEKIFEAILNIAEKFSKGSSNVCRRKHKNSGNRGHSTLYASNAFGAYKLLPTLPPPREQAALAFRPTRGKALRVEGGRNAKLLSQTQLSDDRTVSLDILLRQVSKQILSVTNHLGQTSLRVEVLGVLLQMFGEGVDSLGENGNLYLGRTGVVFTGLVGFDESCFGFFRDHFRFHLSLFLCRKLSIRAGEAPQTVQAVIRKPLYYIFCFL